MKMHFEFKISQSQSCFHFFKDTWYHKGITDRKSPWKQLSIKRNLYGLGLYQCFGFDKRPFAKKLSNPLILSANAPNGPKPIILDEDQMIWDGQLGLSEAKF